jgi:hypothetical protein
MHQWRRGAFNAAAVIALCLAAVAIWLDYRARTQRDTVIRPCMKLELAVVSTYPSPTLVRDVGLSGQINVPPIGRIKAIGLTCAQLETRLNNAYGALGTTATVSFSVRILGFQPLGKFLVGLLLAIPVLRVLCHCWMIGARRRRLLQGHCATCNYNLTGNISGICPECGTEIGKITA